MPPSRVIRQQESNLRDDEETPTEVLDAIRSYTERHQVREMLHILLTRLLEVQPLDPFELLIHTLQQDEELVSLEQNSALQRFDLRREKTMRRLADQLYKYFVALQRTQKLEGLAHLARNFLTSQLRLDETRSYIQKIFPSHYRDLIKWFVTQEQELPSVISPEQFITVCMEILSRQASA